MDSDVDIGTLPILEWQFSVRHIFFRYRNNRCRCRMSDITDIKIDVDAHLWFSPCLTGPVDYPYLLPVMRDPDSKPQEDTYVKPGFSCKHCLATNHMMLNHKTILWYKMYSHKMYNYKTVELLHSHTITQSHCSSGSTVCFPPRGGQRFASWGCTHTSGTGISCWHSLATWVTLPWSLIIAYNRSSDLSHRLL
jgi:hypothetical protein